MIRFITKHGSVYTEHERWKFDGSCHLRGDKTFFVSSEVVDQVAQSLMWNNHSGSRASLTVVDNILVLVVINKHTNEVIPSKCRRLTTATLSPAIGLSPIEIWDKDKKYHVGHEIAHME